MASCIRNILTKRLNKLLITSVRHAARYPETFPSLAKRLKALDVVDAEVSALVDIGLPTPPKSRRSARTLDISKEEKMVLMDAALKRTLTVDLEKLNQDWEEHGMLKAIFMSATHYGIYKDLYQHGYFEPKVLLHAVYPISDTEGAPAYRGNVLTASEVSNTPEVTFKSDPNDLWTLMLTNLDGHLNDSESEYVHWFIANIKGGDVSSGEELIPYLPPFPPRGTGYHRMAFLLYKQDKGQIKYDFPKVTHRYNLKERTFKTFDFYKANQDAITPAGLSFYQVVWDSSVKHVFHNLLEMREPMYEYNQKPKPQKPQEIYPNMEPFNTYLDKYRDPKEMREEVLLKRLKTIDPFKEEPPMPKFPNLHIDLTLPSWYLPNVWKENNRLGRFRDLRPHSIYEQKDFDFHRDMLSKKTGEDPPPSL